MKSSPAATGEGAAVKSSGERGTPTEADATHQRAVVAGARTLEAPFETPYGDRRYMVEDDWGNTWQIATQMT